MPAQCVEFGAYKGYTMGSKSNLLRTLVAAEVGKSTAVGVPGREPKWRRGWDSNPRYP